MPAEGELVVLDDSTSHHLLRVTGIGPNERVEIFDGQGGGAIAELVEVREGMAVLKVVQRQESLGPIGVRVHLLIAQTRANVLDTTLRMVTELGVSSVQIVATERCVAKGDKRERWLRIIESASTQSGRVTLPELFEPACLEDALASRSGDRLVFAPGTDAVRPPRSGEVHMLIGPEGGLSENELSLAVNAGWKQVGLGTTILRADTAAVAAVVRYGS